MRRLSVTGAGALVLAIALVLVGCAASGRKPADPARACREVTLPGGKHRPQTLTEYKTCLEAEKTRLEAQTLDLALAKSQSELRRPSWLAWVLGNFTLLSVIGGAVWALTQYFRDQAQKTRESRSTRFRDTVAGLGGERPEARIGATGLLSTFLERDNEDFFIPVFKLAAGYLRPNPELAGEARASRTPPTAAAAAAAALAGGTARAASRSSRKRGRPAPASRPDVGPLAQMMASVFKASYPLALASALGKGRQANLTTVVASRLGLMALIEGAGGAGAAKAAARRLLDAEGAVLDGTYLSGAAFPCAWLRDSRFVLAEADAIDFTHATLRGARLDGAQMQKSYFEFADLEGATFDGADISGATFEKAMATRASFRDADLERVIFDGADLSGADFTDADIRSAASLRGARMVGVLGLSPGDLAHCRKRGAITREPRDG